MIIQKSKEAKGILEESLSITTPWDKVRLDLIVNILQELKDLVLTQGFTGEQEEIHFFKKYKPYFCGQLRFASRMQKLRMDQPQWSRNYLRPFYQGKLEEVERFFNNQKEMLSYYRSGADHLDEMLFLRGSKSCPIWLCPRRIDADERFSTWGDYPFSEIIAHELMAKYIEAQWSKGEQCPNTPVLTWTGDTINLIELAYGIHCSGQINHGRVGIRDIIRVLSAGFHVTLKRPYRRFSEIRQRKRLSRTRFIDHMATALKQKLEDEEAYHP